MESMSSERQKRDNDQAKAFVEQMCVIREMNSDLSGITADTYFQTLQNIIGYLGDLRRIFNENVEKMEKNDANVKIDYSGLVMCVTVLREYNWVFNLRDGDNNNNSKNNSNEVLDSIERKLISHIETLI